MSRDFITNNYYRKKLTDEAARQLLGKMHKLVDDKDFVRDDSFNGIMASRHVMYKLPTLESCDGKRKYEFLIEMDKEDSDLGIYYGCKGLFPIMDTQQAIDLFDAEWHQIREEVIFLLNNIFPQKDFSLRFRMTDNANDKTYWPFWIALYPDEDIIEVAARALKIIRGVYMRFLMGLPFQKRVIKEKSLPTETAFTTDAFNMFKKSLKSIDKKDVLNLFEHFLRIEMQDCRLIKNECYECCWTVNMDNIEFAYLWVAFCEHANIIKRWEPTQTELQKIPWKGIVTIFVNKEGEPFMDNLKKQFSNHTSSFVDKDVILNDRKKRIKKARMRIAQIFK